jgi:Ca2+-binding RTX toxin-like protein/uncharacterized protein YukE
VTRPPLWRIEARPAFLIAAGAVWRHIARSARSVGTRTERAAQKLLQVWQGEAALAYEEHDRRTTRAFAELSTVAQQVAGLLDDGAGVLLRAQHQLDDAWAATRRRLAALDPAPELAGIGDLGGLNAAQRQALRSAESEAVRIRSHADAALADLVAALDAARVRLIAGAGHIADPLIADPSGKWAAGLDLPEQGQSGVVIMDGNRAVVSATGRDDAILVDVDPVTGESIVTINGTTTRLPAGLDLVVRAGGGNDTITVAPGSQVLVTLLGGSGNDTITGAGGSETILGLWGDDTVVGGGGGDLISGGAGRDYLDGQGGDDRVSGGLGDDTLYGLDGRDLLAGGDGCDYLDGGGDDDALTAGAESDVLVGGRGDDILVGGRGADAMYGGDERDRVLAGDRDDRAFVAPSGEVSGHAQIVTVELTDVGGFIRIEGSSEFVARVRSDLDALRSSPAGAQMLGAIEAEQADHLAVLLPGVGGLFQGDTLVIKETSDRNGYAASFALPVVPTTSVISYNPGYDELGRGTTPPIVVLYHELAHVYDAFYRTSADGTYTGPDNYGVENREREAVGLPIDADGDPSTPDELYPDHPFQLTENGLRAEMLLSARTHY